MGTLKNRNEKLHKSAEQHQGRPVTSFCALTYMYLEAKTAVSFWILLQQYEYVQAVNKFMLMPFL